MLYFLNEYTEKISRGDSTSPLAYKNLYFNSMEQAKNYKKYIYKQNFDEMGVITPSEYIKNEFECRSKIQELLQDNLEINSSLKKYYPNGFENSQEWQKRKEIDFFYKLYNKKFIALLIQSTEFVENILYYKYKASINRTAYSIYNFLSDTKNVNLVGQDDEDILKQKEYFQKEKLELENLIKSQIISYHSLQRETFLKTRFDNELKNQLLKNLAEIDNLSREIVKLNIIIAYDIPNQNFIKSFRLKDLNGELIRYDKNLDSYNLCQISPNGKILKIEQVISINGRNGLVREGGELLDNRSLILVDTRLTGEKIKNPSLTFENKKEFLAEKNVLEGSRGSETLKEFYGEGAIIRLTDKW